ncbi:MAG: gliding motility protein GldM [Bacteroidia bacterium]|nr:gliding motility protein GldM [Bacteroidia bacterium]
MAHEKLSPRQKMIGMMYLVLTAMLALNVQKEVVKAFMKVDKGLKLTVDNYVEKNRIMYSDFAESFATTPVKTGPYYKKALYVKQRADETYEFIQDLKIMMIKEADGKNPPAIRGREIIIDSLVKYDENNIPSQILVGDNEDGKGYELMHILNDFRDSLIYMIVQGENPVIEASLKKTLNFEPGPSEDGAIEPWPNYTFQLMPLVGANALLTKVQVDVRNAETEVINWLYTQIDKSNFKVNKLAAVVLPNSNTVALGTNYEASVVLAGIDTLQRPVITVGQTPLELDDAGRGIYSVKATTLGIKPWNGIISLPSPDGKTTREIPFHSEYQVVESSANIAASAVNVLYAGIPNPLDVSAPGIRPDRIRVNSNTGNIKKERIRNARTNELFPGEWAITPTGEPGSIIQISVSGEGENGQIIKYPPKNFRIKNVPTPVSEFGGKSFGTISLSAAKNMDEVYAVLKEFEFDLQFKVTGFTIMFPGSFGSVGVISNSSKLTPEQKTQIAKMTRGQRLYFDDITAKSPTGKIIALPAISLKID